MRTVLTLACVLIAARHVYSQATCPAIKQFSTTLQPACDAGDLYIKWPNYDDSTTYFSCIGIGNAQITSCPAGQYFIYVLQECGPCSSYIPPVSCEKLKTQSPPVCVAAGTGTTGSGGVTPSGPTLPTPYYPSSSSGTTKTTKTTTTKTPKPTTTPGPEPGTGTTTPGTGPTPPTQIPGGSTLIPPPPTPLTPAPGVPTPPTPPPTPPSVNVEPPPDLSPNY